MKVILRQRGKVSILEFHGEIDAEHAIQLKKALAEIKTQECPQVIIDLQQVHFVDSTGLGVFISLMRHIKEKEGALYLVGLTQEVKSIFEITRLFRVFDIATDVDTALSKIS